MSFVGFHAFKNECFCGKFAAEQVLKSFSGRNIYTYIFFAFLSHCYGFINYFETLVFAYSDIVTRGVLTCKILPF